MHRPHFAWVLLGLAAFSLAACGGGASSPGSTLPPAVGQPGSFGNPTPAALPPVASLNSTSTRAISTSYAQAVLAAKPIAYYQLDGGGAVAYDSSANGLNGTIGSGVTTRAAGLLASSGDTSMRFPGTRSAGGVVSVPPNAKLKVSSQLTMEALLSFSTVPASYTVPLSYGSDAGYAPYDLYFVNGHMDAQFNLSSGVLVVSSPSQLRPNSTYHVVATYNGATATLYLNGAAVASKSKTGTFVGYDNSHGFAIGDDAGFSDPGFAGTVDEVAIYGTPLTASQIQAHYAAATSLSAQSTPAPTTAPLSLASPTPNPALSPTPKPTATPTAAPVTQLVASSGNVATFAGCPIFTAGDWYNKPVAGASTDPNSAAYINGAVAAGATGGLEMYFPSSEYVNIATGSTPKLTVHQKVSYHQFPVPYPWASNFKIEPAGDGHAMVLDTATCHLYESYSTTYTASTNTLAAYSGANWDLSKPFVRLPAGQPSAMAAGLSIFAGMVKWEEVQTGTIHHALNIAIPAGTACYRCYTAPASASESYTYKGSSAYQIPYGGHLRLKASFNVSGLGPQAQVVARALQTYGAYMADTGCCMELWQAVPLDGNDAHWNRSDMATLGKIKLSDFEIMPVGAVTHY